MKPTYLDLLNQRIENEEVQSLIKVQVALKPILFDQLRVAQEAVAQERNRLRREGAQVKMNDTTLEELTQVVEDLEQQIQDTTLVVTLHALTTDDLLKSHVGTDIKTPSGIIWKKDLTQAFVRAEDGNGNLVEDIHQEEWARLLEVIPAAEVQTWHGMLGQAGMAPNFPTFKKS